MRRKYPAERIYMAEEDIHFPELTVGETLAFAATTREKDPLKSRKGKNSSTAVARLFALDSAIDTRIGNAMIRGVSGGERKRTSIAEAVLNCSQVQCWDNSTRGLDSLTAVRFVKLLRASTDSLKSTVLMSIYQASEEMYQQFDNVTLLYEGHQIYCGPTSSAAVYFHRLGFERPSRATTADFLTSLTNPAERVARARCEGRVPRSAEDFARCWAQSDEARALKLRIHEFLDKHPVSVEGSLNSQRGSAYTISVHRQVLACAGRGFLRLHNNLAPVIAGIVGNTIIAIITGSVFYNLGETTESLQKRSVLLFFAIMINALTPAFEVSRVQLAVSSFRTHFLQVLTMWAHRPVVEKHHRYILYRPAAEACASIVCDLPNKIITTVMFNIPIYFMTNLRRTVSAWFIYLLFCFVTVVTMSMFFRMVGSASRTSAQTMAPVAMLILLFITYAGFVVPSVYMVPWLGWFRWLNPIAYAYESLMINEV